MIARLAFGALLTAAGAAWLTYVILPKLNAESHLTALCDVLRMC